MILAEMTPRRETLFSPFFFSEEGYYLIIIGNLNCCVPCTTLPTRQKGRLAFLGGGVPLGSPNSDQPRPQGAFPWLWMWGINYQFHWAIFLHELPKSINQSK